MPDWPARVHELVASDRADQVRPVLARAAEDDPVAARELGHLLLLTSWADTQADAADEVPAAERWLRRALSARPEDVESLVLLAALLSMQVDRISDLAPQPRRDAGRRRRAAEAVTLYLDALRLDPRCGSAATGLARLLGDVSAPAVPGAPTAVAAAERAVLVEPDDPVAAHVRAETAGPHGHGSDQGTGRFDYFVVTVALLVGNSGETVRRHAVLPDLDRLRVFDACAANVTTAVAQRYESGVRVAAHRAARLSGRGLGRVAADWPAPGGTDRAAGARRPLPAGHPVRHDGRTLLYGVNGAWARDEPL